MTTTKKQLFTAIAMLLIAAMALSTSTYAWFVANKVAEVESMNFQAEAVDTLQIALTTDAWNGTIAGTGATAGTFKSLVTVSEITDLYTAKSANFADALKPASTVNGKDFFMEKTWDATGQYVKEFVATTTIADKGVKVIPVFLQSNTAKKLVLSSQSAITGDAAPAARMAVVVDGTTKLLWAPVAATTHVTSAAITTQIGANTADGITNAVGGEGLLGAISPAVKQMVTLDADIELATLAASTPKMALVYVWLEGCDQDCVSTITSSQLSVALKFTVDDVA